MPSADSSFIKKIVYLAVVMLVFIIGYNTTLPFMNKTLISDYSANTFGLLGLPLENTTSIFALGILPYITASILFSLVSIIVPKIKNLNSGTESDNSILRMLTLAVSLLIATSQFFILRSYWVSLDGVYAPQSTLDEVQVFIMLVTGFLVLVMLGFLVSKLGIFQGSSFILVLTLVLGFRHSYSFLSGPGVLIPSILITLSLLVVVSFVALSFVEITTERSTYPNFNNTFPLFLKLFSTGIAPLVFSSAVTGLVYLVYPDIVNQILLYYSFILLVTVVLSFIWAKNTYDPLVIANTLAQNNIIIRNTLPGVPTAFAINNAVNFTAVISSVIVGYSFIAFSLISVTAVQGVAVTLFIILSLDIISKLANEYRSKVKN